MDANKEAIAVYVEVILPAIPLSLIVTVILLLQGYIYSPVIVIYQVWHKDARCFAKYAIITTVAVRLARVIYGFW